MRTHLIVFLVASLASVSVCAEETLTEQDYFAEMPIALTVNRLVQPLSEAPGAVTVIDRAKIRESGARDLTELLRWVPGYLVSGYNGANPNAVYHMPLDDFGARNLVLVDGRPIYSTYQLGGTSRMMQLVPLESIERIEVLRGSNAAAYGANAMFGVVHVITRHTQDTLGQEVSLASGGNGVQDAYARLGWRSETGSHGLALGRRQDAGYDNFEDNRDIRHLQWRADLNPTRDDEVMLKLGASEMRLGDGLVGDVGNRLRTVAWRDWHVQGQWKRQFSDSEQLQLRLSVQNERVQDRFPYDPVPGVMVDASGRGRQTNLEVQYQWQAGPSLRGVWGAGWKHESVQSLPLYATQEAQTAQEHRLFGTLAWNIRPRWLLNAGLFVGRHDRVGAYAAPRLMLNYQPTPQHTWRAGWTRSARTPGLFEQAADVRYHLNDGTFVGRTVAARGHIEPESMDSWEIGYLGHFPDLRVSFDARAYLERLRNLVDGTKYVLPAGEVGAGSEVRDYINVPGFTVRGLEYQWRWAVSDDAEIWLSQNWMQFVWADRTRDDHFPPGLTSSLSWFQRLPGNARLTLSLFAKGRMSWRSAGDALPATRRWDVRLAYPFRIGSTKAEAGLTVQALNGDQPEFVRTASPMVGRRAFATLRMEF